MRSWFDSTRCPADRQPPLVLLVPVAEGGEPRVADPEQQPGAPYLVARFDNVAPGEYVVAFEPLPNAPAISH